jgi:hypothetical protein
MIYLSILPIFGSLMSTLISRKMSRDDARRANEYNHPANIAKRLKEAGMSPSMYFSKGAGGQPSAVPDAPNIDPTLGAAATLQGMQRSKQLTTADKLAELQMDDLKTRTEGQRLNNQLTQEKLNRYNDDRDLDNALRYMSVTSSVSNQRHQERINALRAEIAQQAENRAQTQQNIDQEQWKAEQMVRLMQFELRKAESESARQMAMKNYFLEAGRLAIAQGQLNATYGQLNLAYKKYKHDYALHEAITSAFDGNIDWASIASATGKEIPKVVLRALRKFLF